MEAGAVGVCVWDGTTPTSAFFPGPLPPTGAVTTLTVANVPLLGVTLVTEPTAPWFPFFIDLGN